MKRTTPPAAALSSAPSEAATAEVTPRPPEPLASAVEASAPVRSVRTLTSARSSTTTCSGVRSDLARARLAFGMARALSSESYAWLARALDERFSQMLGTGQPFDCGPLTRCYEPTEPPTDAALTDLGRGPLPGASPDLRSRPARWSERYELAAIALGHPPPNATSPAAFGAAHEAGWRSAIAGVLPSFGALAQLATEHATLVAIVPPATRQASLAESATQPVSTPSTGEPPQVPLEQRRVALVRTVPSDADERALISFAPATARARRALARAVRALAAAQEPPTPGSASSSATAIVRETPGGLVQLALVGAPEVTLAQLGQLSASFARLTSAGGKLSEDALLRARGVEPPPLDRTCDALLGGAHAPPSSLEVLDALRDASILTVLEVHAPEKPTNPRQTPPPAPDFTRPLAELHFASRAFVVGPGDRIAAPTE